MARISQGVYGGISGKLGNTVGASWKGIHYLRILPASVANPNTTKQQGQRQKFLVTLKFLQPLDIPTIPCHSFRRYPASLTFDFCG